MRAASSASVSSDRHRHRHAADRGGSAQRGEVVVGRVARCPHDDAAHRAVTEHVRLAAQAGAVDLPPEALRPPPLVRLDGRCRWRCGPPERDEAVDVVGAAGLRPAADRGSLPSAERLATDDRPGRVPVDVGVAHLDPLQPALDLALVEAVQAAGQAVVDGVLQLDGVVEVVGAHHAEHRAEALRLVEPRARADADAHAGRPEPVVDPARLDQPLLAVVERRERAGQRSRRRVDHRADHRRQVGGRPDAQAAHGVGQAAAERADRRTAAPRRSPGSPPSTSGRRGRTPSGRGRAGRRRRRRSG